MISVIICSKSTECFQKLSKNIFLTIGTAFEIIEIDNKSNAFGICSAYNLGISKAKFEYLCFVHEDVEFRSLNWGGTLAAYFKTTPNLGLLGLGGSKYKSSFPSGWGAFDRSSDLVNINMPLGNGEIDKFYNNPGGKPLSEALVIDGVLLFTTKQICEQVKFNEEIKGFHFYDIDFSLRVFEKGYTTAIENTIEVLHHSRGNFDDRWMKAAIKYHYTNKALIKKILQKAKPEQKNSDEVLQIYWLRRFSKFNISLYYKLRLIMAYKIYFSRDYLKTCYRFIRYSPK